MGITCSKVTYEAFQKINLLETAKESKKDIWNIRIGRNIWQEACGEIVKKAESGSTEEEKDITELSDKLNGPMVFDVRPHILEHPFLFTSLLNIDTSQYQDLGFSSKKEFSKSVVAFCLSEWNNIMDDSDYYEWRIKNYKNVVNLDSGVGDVSVMQYNLDNIVGDHSDLKYRGFKLNQDFSPFFIAVLKYAKAIGKETIQEITEWRDLVPKIRTSNVWGFGNRNFEKRLDSYLKMSLHDDLVGTGGMYSVGRFYAALVDDKLALVDRDQDGELEFSIHDNMHRFTQKMEFFPEDLPDLLKSSYKLYARSPEDMCSLLYHFTEGNIIQS